MTIEEIINAFDQLPDETIFDYINKEPKALMEIIDFAVVKPHLLRRITQSNSGQTVSYTHLTLPTILRV